VVFAADHGLDPGYMQVARGWSAEEWADALDRLVRRGLCNPDGTLTDQGAELRSWVESRTDEAAEAPWRAVGPEDATRLAELLTPIAARLAQQNEAMRPNPLALDAAALLTGRPQQ
jgi:hypothetical protein